LGAPPWEQGWWAARRLPASGCVSPSTELVAKACRALLAPGRLTSTPTAQAAETRGWITALGAAGAITIANYSGSPAWARLDLCVLGLGRVWAGVRHRCGNRVSSITWLDAFIPADGQRPLDFTNEASRKIAQAELDKGEAGFAHRLTPRPFLLLNARGSLSPRSAPTCRLFKLSGAREKVSEKTYMRTLRIRIPPSIRRDGVQGRQGMDDL
jgi:hypothetical protein